MRLILVVVLLLAACSSPPPPPAPITPPTWTREPAPTLPYERLAAVHGAAGWNGGFVAVGWYSKPDEVPTNRTPPVLHMSADGRTWREITPPGVRDFVNDGAAVGHGDRGYVLAEGGSEPVVLTSEGGVWTRMRLPGAISFDDPASIAAGPRGVVVVAMTGVLGGEQTANGLKIWHSADGEKFGDPVELTGTHFYTEHPPRVVATERGFLMVNATSTEDLSQRRAKMLYESEDGREWTARGDELPDPPANHYYSEINAAQHNNGVTVVFGRTRNFDDVHAPDAGLVGWYRRDGEETWTQLADIDPGKLPDAGVVPRNERRMDEVFRYQTGFLAVGMTDRDAAVWTSADGVAWKKMPVRDNGFVTTGRLQFLTDGSLGMLMRKSPNADELGEVKGPTGFWRSGERKKHEPANHPVPKGGSWKSHFGSVTLDDNGAGEVRYWDLDDHRSQFAVKFRPKHMTKGGTRTLEVTESNDPEAPVGSSLSAKVERNGPTVLFPDGVQREFCGEGRYDECS